MEEDQEADSGQRQPAGQEEQNEHIPGSSDRERALEGRLSRLEIEMTSLQTKHTDLLAKHTDVLAHVAAQDVARQDSESRHNAEIHAMNQRLTRRTAAEVLATPAPSSSTPSHISATPAPPSAAPAAARSPANPLPPPPPRSRTVPQTGATPPQTKPATKELFLQLPATSHAGATVAQMEALFSSQAHIPCSVRALPPRRSQARPAESEEESPASVRAMAALGLVMVPQQRKEGSAAPAPDAPEDTRQRFIVTFAMESERSVWRSYSKLRRLGLIFHDNLTPEQQRHKAAQKGMADTLRAAGPIRWDYDQLSKLVHGRWVAVPFRAQ